MLSDVGRRDNALIGKASTCNLFGCLLRQQLKVRAQASILGRKGRTYRLSKPKGNDMAKMNHWRTNKICGRPSLDHRWENLTSDGADRWLAAVERRQRERRRPRERRASFSSTQSSSF
jgi:hypothetical protein